MTIDPRPLLLLALLGACAGPAGDDVDDTDTDVDDTDDTDADDTDETDPTACTVEPGAWSAPDWDTNAAGALAVRAAIDTLAVVAMREGEQGTRTLDEVADLEDLAAAGDPSVDDIVTAAFAPVMAAAFEEYVDLLAAGAQDLVDDGDGSFVGGEAGGIFGTSLRGIHEGGVEVRQIVDKGLFGGGALYPWAMALTEGTVDAGTIDAIAAAWGADATLSATGTLTDTASYAHGTGRFEVTSDALIAAKAYAADANCADERDAALVDAFRAWELDLVGRAVFYANAASTRMAAASSENDVAEAIHGVSEGLGLIAGLVGVPDPAAGPLAGAGAVATDEELAQMMAALGLVLDDLAASTTGEVCADPSALATAVTALEAVVASTYDLGEDEIAALRPQPAG